MPIYEVSFATDRHGSGTPLLLKHTSADPFASPDEEPVQDAPTLPKSERPAESAILLAPYDPSQLLDATTRATSAAEQSGSQQQLGSHTRAWRLHVHVHLSGRGGGGWGARGAVGVGGGGRARARGVPSTHSNAEHEVSMQVQPGGG